MFNSLFRRGVALVALAGALAVALGHTAQAETAPDVDALVTPAQISAVREHLSTEIVTRSIRAQNAQYGSLSQQEIDALDKQWRAEREATDKPLISMTLSNPLSSYLTRVQADSFGLYTAVFVMDRNGLNVGQSAITSDFWQGDEAKFQNTFPKGPKAVFVDAAEELGEHGIWIAQINLTLADPKTGEPIGAATVDINLTELERRAALESTH